MIERIRLGLRRAGFDEPAIARRAIRFEAALQAHRVLVPNVDAATLLAFHVPGRIEVFGKHTDYAGGRSLLCATEQGFAFIASPRDDNRLRLLDAALGEQREYPLDPSVEPPTADWGNYPATIARRVSRDLGVTRGADVAFISDLPFAAGVSSSSALVVGTYLIVAELNGRPALPSYRSTFPTLEDVAGYLGAVENGRAFGPFPVDRGVGTEGGSQDQTAILCCKPNRLVQYGFVPVRFEGEVPVPPDVLFAVAASGVVAEKTGAVLAHYNEAARVIAELLVLWRQVTGRDDPSLGAALQSGPAAADLLRGMIEPADYPPAEKLLLRARLVQFDRESFALIPEAARALAAHDLPAFGRAAAASQAGAELGIRNQIPETIGLVRMAAELGALAASAFGAGFGGSVWALVRRGEGDQFLEDWAASYRREFPAVAGRAQFFLTGAAPAACRLW